jgi:hypothetical protein
MKTPVKNPSKTRERRARNDTGRASVVPGRAPPAIQRTRIASVAEICAKTHANAETRPRKHSQPAYKGSKPGWCCVSPASSNLEDSTCLAGTTREKCKNESENRNHTNRDEVSDRVERKAAREHLGKIVEFDSRITRIDRD